MITVTQVKDLQAGDVVEMTWPDGAKLQGPLAVEYESYGDQMDRLRCGPIIIRHMDGQPSHAHRQCDLKVIERAARPIYVNHARTEPAVGDIARDRDGDAWRRGEDGWYLTGCDARLREIQRSYRPLTLLWDGATGQVVP